MYYFENLFHDPFRKINATDDPSFWPNSKIILIRSANEKKNPMRHSVEIRFSPKTFIHFLKKKNEYAWSTSAAGKRRPASAASLPDFCRIGPQNSNPPTRPPPHVNTPRSPWQRPKLLPCHPLGWSFAALDYFLLVRNCRRRRELTISVRNILAWKFRPWLFSGGTFGFRRYLGWYKL